jgi:hypothetical protein
MNPVRSSSNSENCVPISSNCVVWQGPDLPCLHLCKGDSVSDVVYKVAVEVCNLKDSIGLTDLDISCLLQICQTTPEPAKTLANILELLINKVCCINDIIENLPPPGNNYQEPILTLPSCLYIPDGVGGFITQLVHSQYTLRVATILCQINTTVNTHTGQIADLDTRVTALENAVDPVLQVSSCLTGTVEDIDVAVEELETQFCQYKNTLGSISDLTIAQSKQCITGADIALSTGDPMSSIPGWQNTVTSIGKSLQNMWITICDIRAAVKAIQDNCCKVDCNSIIPEFDYRWIDAVTLRFFFFPKFQLPLGFWDCNDLQGNQLTLTDGLGNEYVTYIHFRREDPNDLTGVLDDPAIISGGYNLDLTNSPLDVTTGITITSNLCFTNGDVTCIKCLDKSIIGYVDKTCCTITATGPVTIVYKVCQTVNTTTTTTTTTISQ